MMKTYEYNGSRFQFEEGKQPKGYVEVKAGKPSNKAHDAKSKAAADVKAKAEAEAAAKAEADAKAKADSKQKKAE